MKLLSFVGEKWQNLPFIGRTRTLVLVPKVGTSTHGQRQSGTCTNQSGTGTHSQKRVGTGTDQSGIGIDTDQSGIGIDASNSPDFCILALLSPRFIHR